MIVASKNDKISWLYLILIINLQYWYVVLNIISKSNYFAMGTRLYQLEFIFLKYNEIWQLWKRNLCSSSLSLILCIKFSAIFNAYFLPICHPMKRRNKSRECSKSLSNKGLYYWFLLGCHVLKMGSIFSLSL